MEKIKSSAERYGKRLGALFAVSGGVTALCIAIETLLGAFAFLGVSHPESVLDAVKTHVFGSVEYKISVFLLAALTIFICARYMRTQNRCGAIRYALVTLAVREGTVLASDTGHYALRLLGLDGGVNTLVSPDGYLIRMAEPLLSVISGAVVTAFSVAYLCAFFASFGGCSDDDKAL